MPKVLTRLDKDPIFDATFEYRFRSTVSAAADIVQAVVFGALRDRFPKISRHPFADFASAFTQDPTLRYQPRLILRGDNTAVFIGDRSIMVSCTKPYIGWAKFRPLIVDVMQLVRKADVVKETERISLRYINVLSGEDVSKQFSLVHFDATLGRQKLNMLHTQIRTEIPKDGLINIVQLTPNGTMKSETHELHGLVLSIDTVYNQPPDFLQDPLPHIEKAHATEKSIFVEVLTDDTLMAMGPTWDNA